MNGMTPQFTTACFIRKNTPELRKELEDIGYIKHPKYYSEKGKILSTAKDGYYQTFSGCQIGIDCETDETLFLDLAGMRIDTDKGQWFICYKALSECQYMVGEMTKCYDDEQSQFINPGQYLRRATADEIVKLHIKWTSYENTFIERCYGLFAVWVENKR